MGNALGRFISSGDGQMVLVWGPLGVDTSSAVLVRPSFVIVVSAPLGELISVQVGAAGLAHYSYRIHLDFLNGRGQGRPLFRIGGEWLTRAISSIEY